MITREIIDKALSKLMGKVFHVTTLEAFESIKQADFIYPNVDDIYSSPFGRSNGYFKNKRCVSFFDYRLQLKHESYIFKCLPTEVFEYSKGMVILELSPNQYGNLISWREWDKEKAFAQKVVPYVEVGLKGAVNIKDIIKITIIERPSTYKTMAEFEREIGL